MTFKGHRTVEHAVDGFVSHSHRAAPQFPERAVLAPGDLVIPVRRRSHDGRFVDQGFLGQPATQQAG